MSAFGSQGRGGASRLFFFMLKITGSLKIVLSIAALSGIAYLLYYPGLFGPFLFDDFPNLSPLAYSGGISDTQSALRFIFGNNSGPTGRPVSMATFLLNDHSWPSIPFYFKQTNLLLHIACGLMVFLVLGRLLRDRSFGKNSDQIDWLCFVVVSIWLIHPINLSTVLYVVQRMTILSAFFAMASLYFYLIFRNQYFEKRGGQLRYLLISIVLLVLGVFSKENAVLVVPFVAFLEILYFKRPICPKMKGFVVENAVLIMGGVVIIIVISSGWWAQGYDQRSFGLYDRVKYQFPVMGDYILKIIFPKVSSFNLFSGDYESVSNQALSVLDVFKSIVTLTCIVLAVALVKLKKRVAILGGAWFFIFHLLESTFYPLEMYFEHRNYLPSVGLIFLVVVGIISLFERISSGSFLKRAVFLSSTVYLSWSLFLLSSTWASSDTLFLKWEMDEPKSARAKVVYAALVEQRTFPENSIEHVSRAIDLKPKALGLHLKRLRLICQYQLDYDLIKVESELKSADEFEMGVVAALSDLIKLDSDGDGLICESLGHSIHISDLFSMVESSDEEKWNATRAARFYSLKSDFFSYRGNLNVSVISIDKAIEYTPTVDLYLKKSVMLASAGLQNEALGTLELAEVADSNRANFYPSRIKEIRKLRHLIESIGQHGQNYKDAL